MMISKFGKGKGMGQGPGKQEGQAYGPGSGQGRNKGGSYGTGGYCICMRCGHKTRHRRGIKCTTLKCPQCGHTMIREEMVRDKQS